MPLVPIKDKHDNDEGMSMPNYGRPWVLLFGAALVLFLAGSAGPPHAAPTASSGTETAGPLSGLSQVFGVSEAAAKKPRCKGKPRPKRCHKPCPSPAPSPAPAPPPASSPSPAPSPSPPPPAPVEGQERWSDPTTRGGEVPGEGDSVTIPAEQDRPPRHQPARAQEPTDNPSCPLSR